MQLFAHRNRVVFLHLMFWCVYISFYLYQSIERGYDWGRTLMFTSIQLGFVLLTAYLNFFFFLPRFLVHKNIWRYFLEFILPFTVLVLSRVYLWRYILADSPRIDYLNSTTFVVQIAATTLFTVIFVGMLRFAVDWFELEAKKKEIQNEKLVAELNFLKAQINPHFLFNTLNNLYYLAYSKSENTTEVIAKLSQMMRYMIYDSNHPKVLLSKEIEYMQSYISLEKMRLSNHVPIQFDIEGNTENVWIAPLIFITFLENAFKHGVISNNPDAWVKISIRLKGKECVYTVENSKPTSKNATGEKSGIGLQNVQRRLELSYPGQHTLAIQDKPQVYFVQLNLQLS